MRAILAVLLLLGAPLAARAEDAAPAAPAAPAGHLEVAERVHDAGRIDRGERLTYAFVLRNTGAGDLHVDAKPG